MSLKLNERYPGRMNNPSADYPQGSFKNRTTPVAKDGSYLEQDWANDKEGFFQSLLAAVGATANGSVDKVGASQFFDSLIQTHQQQIGVAFTTTGTATAQVLTPTPAIPAYSVYQRFNVTFNTVSGANPTINVSGLGAKSLKQYDSTGAKVAAVFAANQNSDIVYDGTDWVLLDPLPPASSGGIQGAFSNLKVSATGTSVAVTVTADAICLKNSSNEQVVINALSLAINSATIGVNGLDIGVLAASTWYSVWAIWNGATSTAAGLLSLSATAPTMPAGYTHKARLGWVRTDTTANKYPLSFLQQGRSVQYKVTTGSNVPTIPILLSGVAGSIMVPTWVPIAVGAFVPPTAAAIKVTTNNSNTGFIVAPNNSFGGVGSLTNPPPFLAYPGSQVSSPGLILLESSSIYVATSGATTVITCFGWEDSL